jgi:HD-GYP domain-containing protein (c-di-GMP phosphodiesterase class II)
MVDVFADPRSGKNLRRAQGLVEATVMSIMKRPDSLWQMTSVASHDYYTYTHCVNVCMFLVGASRELLGVEGESQLRRIGLGGIFHDVGKSQVPEHILNKPGKLTPEEFEEIKRHPALGVELIAEQRSLSAVASAIVRSHHERYEGGGYPDGVPAEGLREVVRLSTIIDVYDALTTERCYARARSPFAALQLMLNDMDGHFDPDLLRRFVAFLGPSQAKGPPMEALRVVSGEGE